MSRHRSESRHRSAAEGGGTGKTQATDRHVKALFYQRSFVIYEVMYIYTPHRPYGRTIAEGSQGGCSRRQVLNHIEQTVNEGGLVAAIAAHPTQACEYPRIGRARRSEHVCTSRGGALPYTYTAEKRVLAGASVPTYILITYV
jgi:hypothetical protein